jgi:hypothetical protein
MVEAGGAPSPYPLPQGEGEELWGESLPVRESLCE